MSVTSISLTPPANSMRLSSIAAPRVVHAIAPATSIDAAFINRDSTAAKSMCARIGTPCQIVILRRVDAEGSRNAKRLRIRRSFAVFAAQDDVSYVFPSCPARIAQAASAPL